MSRKYKIRDQNYPHFVSFAVVHWIDLFTRPTYKQILIDSLIYCQKNKGLVIYAWCIMTNHVHLIIGTNRLPMEGILRDMKSFTSRKLKEAIIENEEESRKKWILWIMEQTGKKNKSNYDWQLWQQHNHPIELSNEKLIHQRLDYLHKNPVEAGFVQNPEDWLYSSAGDYCGRKGFLDVVLIE
ncbi:MAG: transposase [Balneolaceae bacterium]|nr:MAG: transposase [Balneolaceae bacterium]